MGPSAGASSTLQRCYERRCFSQSWFLHLGLVKLNGVEHMQTNAFVLGGQSCSPAPDWHSYTESYCFPFAASCHSLCQSLIRTMSFHRLISHSSNFLTLHNEKERNSKGLTKRRDRPRERNRERERSACALLSIAVRTSLSLFRKSKLCQIWTEG